jgi:hypothetical protein
VIAAWCLWVGTSAIKLGIETWQAQQSGIPAHVVVTQCRGVKGGHCMAIWQSTDGTAERVEVIGWAHPDEAVDVRIVGNRAYQTDLFNRFSGFIWPTIPLVLLSGLLIVVRRRRRRRSRAGRLSIHSLF